MSAIFSSRTRKVMLALVAGLALAAYLSPPSPAPPAGGVAWGQIGQVSQVGGLTALTCPTETPTDVLVVLDNHRQAISVYQPDGAGLPQLLYRANLPELFASARTARR